MRCSFYFMTEAYAKPISPQTPAQTNITSNSSRIVAREGNIEPPVSKYSDVYGMPYSAKLFDVNYDLGVNKGNVDILDSYILRQIESRGLKDDYSSFNQILNELYSKIGIEHNQLNDVKFNKLVQYISLLSRNKSKDDRKKDLIKREKEVEKEKEERKREILKDNYEKLKEEKKEWSKKDADYKEKLQKIEKQYNEEIIKNDNKQKDFDNLLSKIEIKIKSFQANRENDFKLLDELKLERDKLKSSNNKITEENIILKTKLNKLKSLIT